MDTKSYWRKTAALPRFEKLKSNYKVDVVVIGAGITGITAAYLLKKTDHTVALLERGRRLGGFDTSNTTAHLTCVTDVRLHELVHRFGKDTARAVWDGGRAAIDLIFNNVRNESIDCEFTWVPAYLHASLQSEAKKERQSLEKDCQIAVGLERSRVTVQVNRE